MEGRTASEPSSRWKRTETRRCLHSFGGSQKDGRYPSAALIQDSKGALYGTTQQGGAFGFGTVFKIDESGNEKVLHSLAGNPHAGSCLWHDRVRRRQRWGVVFSITTAGTLTVLHSFGGPDGAGLLTKVVLDSAGNPHGTATEGGANNQGTVFKLSRKDRVSPPGWQGSSTFTVLLAMQGLWCRRSHTDFQAAEYRPRIVGCHVESP